MNDLTPIFIDLSKGKEINESFFEMFGTAVKLILRRMFGKDVFLPPISITGDPSQVESFARALAGEKKYFDSYVKHGLNDPRTYKTKYELQASINQFERDTGIKWPFK
jgi:hypothetical protein